MVVETSRSTLRCGAVILANSTEHAGAGGACASSLEPHRRPSRRHRGHFTQAAPCRPHRPSRFAQEPLRPEGRRNLVSSVPDGRAPVAPCWAASGVLISTASRWVGMWRWRLRPLARPPPKHLRPGGHHAGMRPVGRPRDRRGARHRLDQGAPRPRRVLLRGAGRGRICATC